MPINYLQQGYNTTAQENSQLVSFKNTEEISTSKSVRLLCQKLEELDYSALYEAYSSIGRNPATEPKTLFKIVVYANMNGINSSRKIAAACRKNNCFILLLEGENAPSYSEINHFRKRRLGKIVGGLITQFKEMLRNEQTDIKFDDIFFSGAEVNTDHYKLKAEARPEEKKRNATQASKMNTTVSSKNGAEMAFEKLNDAINIVVGNKEKYVNRPGKDFTRESKISFKDMIVGIMGMGGNSLDREILDGALDGLYKGTVPTPSAFVQRRASIKSEAFETVYRKHVKTCSTPKTWRGRYVYADDGSDLVYMEDKTDQECNFDGYNKIHINALHDLCNNIYADALIDLGREIDEREAAVVMAARYPKTEGQRPIMTADRGYEAYNLIAHLEKSGWDYCIRVKDIDSNGILSGLRLAESDGALDIDVRLLLTRKQTNEVKAHPEIYKILSSQCKFDFLEGRDTYEISFRIVRVQLPNGGWECLLTNLGREDFPPEILFELYGMRWGIENSFRLLKNALCLKNVHSKKRDSIKQEAYAKLTMYNYCSESIFLATDVTRHDAEQVLNKTGQNTDHALASDSEYISKPNFTFLAHLCMRIVRGCSKALDIANVLLCKVRTLVKKGRSFERGKIKTGPVSFQYRVT